MTQRANYFGLANKAMQILMEQEGYLSQQFSASEKVTTRIWELVKLRISQINQCAFCIDMHSKDALKQGESAERLLGLNAWQEMPLYSNVERAALQWAEDVLNGQSAEEVPYQRAVEVLGEQAVVDLTIATNAISSWNRIAKTFKPEVGSYQP